jgi:hypothetical protein
MMARINNRNSRGDRQNEKHKHNDAASNPGRFQGKYKELDGMETQGRENMRYLRAMNINRLNDLYERGSI